MNGKSKKTVSAPGQSLARDARILRGLSMRELAAKAGVDPTTIHNYEHSLKTTQGTALLIAKALRVSPLSIFPQLFPSRRQAKKLGIALPYANHNVKRLTRIQSAKLEKKYMSSRNGKRRAAR